MAAKRATYDFMKSPDPKIIVAADAKKPTETVAARAFSLAESNFWLRNLKIRDYEALFARTIEDTNHPHLFNHDTPLGTAPPYFEGAQYKKTLLSIKKSHTDQFLQPVFAIICHFLSKMCQNLPFFGPKQVFSPWRGLPRPPPPISRVPDATKTRHRSKGRHMDQFWQPLSAKMSHFSSKISQN